MLMTFPVLHAPLAVQLATVDLQQSVSLKQAVRKERSRPNPEICMRRSSQMINASHNIISNIAVKHLRTTAPVTC